MKITTPPDTTSTSTDISRRGSHIRVGRISMPEGEARIMAGEILSTLGTCDFEIYDHPRTDEDTEQHAQDRAKARERAHERADEYARAHSDDEAVQALLRRAFIDGIAEAPRSPSNRMGFRRWERTA